MNNTVDIKPYQGPYKVYIIPQADLMTPQAQNAILKTIEEPPAYAVFLLLTENAGDATSDDQLQMCYAEAA